MAWTWILVWLSPYVAAASGIGDHHGEHESALVTSAAAVAIHGHWHQPDTTKHTHSATVAPSFRNLSARSPSSPPVFDHHEAIPNELPNSLGQGPDPPGLFAFRPPLHHLLCVLLI
jgi:hypothetical protein